MPTTCASASAAWCATCERFDALTTEFVEERLRPRLGELGDEDNADPKEPVAAFWPTGRSIQQAVSRPTSCEIDVRKPAVVREDLESARDELNFERMSTRSGRRT
jgi:hypothetical protein